MSEDDAVEHAGSASDVGAVTLATERIKNLIRMRALQPGQQVRQIELAEQTGVSRGPIREALQILMGEGVVTYQRNRGYFIRQFSADELSQLYLMRNLLETPAIESIPAPIDPAVVDRLVELNLAITASESDVGKVVHCNDEFHLTILSLSPLQMLVDEIHRIWANSASYRALSVSLLPEWSKIAHQHDEMLDAIREGDMPLLAELSRTHRDQSLLRLLPILR